MIFNGLDGFDGWVMDAPDDYLHVKIYNGKFTQRGSGNPFIKFQAEDKDDLIQKTKQHLSGGGSGKMTIAISNRDSGGEPLRRFIEFNGSSNNNSVAGTGGGTLDAIGGLAGWMQDQLELNNLRRDLEDAIEQVDYWKEKAENPEQDSFIKQFIQDFRRDPQTIAKSIREVVGAVSLGYTAIKNPHVLPTMNGGTELNEVQGSGEVPPEVSSQYDEAELQQFLTVMVEVHQQHFSDRSLVEVAKALQQKLQTMPVLAQSLFA